MRRVLSLVTLVVVVLIGSSAPAAASTSLTTQASQVRASVVDLSREFEQRYGPRVTSTERRELREMTREARREMNTLQRLVSKADRTQSPRDWRRALDHYEVIRATGDTRLDEARDILAPRMSLAEQLQAWSTASSVLQDLDSLGTELDRRAG